MTNDQINGDMSILTFIPVVFLYILSVWTAQQWASAATIFAGFSAGGYTLFKWYLLYKQNKKSKNDRDIPEDK